MLKIILLAFKKLDKMLTDYQIKQGIAIDDAEVKLIEMKQDLATAEKLAKKLEL